MPRPRPDTLAWWKTRNPCSKRVSAFLRAVWPVATVLWRIVDTKGNKMLKCYAMRGLLPLYVLVRCRLHIP